MEGLTRVLMSTRFSLISNDLMPGDRQHVLLRHRRLRNWAVLVVVFALLAWGIELAAHRHVNQDLHGSAQNSHFCQICAAFQAGATTAAVATSIPKLQPTLTRTVAPLPHPRLQLVLSYRSRAPPHA